jgi:hypothetical protein
MRNELADILNAYNSQTLSLIISYLGFSLIQKNKQTMVEVLSVHFQDRKQIAEMEALLSPAQREVVNLILQRNGKASMITIRQRLLRAGFIDANSENSYSTNYHYPDHKAKNSRYLSDIMANLLARGLVFAWRATPGISNAAMLDMNLSDVYVIPASIRKHLAPPPPEPPWVPKAAKAPAKIMESSARSFQRDLFLYWSYIRQNNIELTNKGLIPKRHLVPLNNTLLVREEIRTGDGENDFHRLFIIRSLLITLDLLDYGFDFIRTKADAAFFHHDPKERILKTLQAYRQMAWWNEIVWTYPVKSYLQLLTPAPKRILEARQAILDQLKPVQGWITLAEFTARMAEYNYEFLFQRQVTGSNYYNRNNIYSGNINPGGWDFPGVYSEEDGWDQVEANFIRITICEFLFWMGLVDLGYSDASLEQPDVFQLTPVGKWLLSGDTPPNFPKDSGQVIVQPDFTITAFDPVSDAVLHQLEQFAHRISAERAAVYRLTQQSVYTGQKNGWDATRISSTLEELTGQTLPQNVARSLTEWQSWHERIRIRPDMVVLQTADPQDLLMLVKDQEISTWFKKQPVPGTVILPPGLEPRALMDSLAKHAWLPEVVFPTNEMPVRSITIHPDGRLTFNVRAPDLYLKSYLARFADAEEDGYRITKNSVKRALAGKLDAPKILNALAHISTNKIPPDLEKKIMAWSGHYGSARLEETMLLRLRDEKALKDLLQDPDLSALLHPIQPAEMSVTVKVKTSDRQRLIQLLEERGIDLHSK